MKIFSGFLFNSCVVYVASYRFSAQKEMSRGFPPLQTASTGVARQIPRLDPGMRLIKNLGFSYSPANFISACKPLDWLTYNCASQDCTLSDSKVVFGEVMKIVQQNLKLYLRNIAANTLVAAASMYSQLSPGIRRMAITTSAVVSVIGAPKAAFASIFKSYNKLAPFEKLGTTPLFYVCNSGGSPYLQDDLQTGNPDQRVIVYFMSSEDAFDYMNEMAQGSPGNVNEFRVMTTSMEKIVQRIRYKKQSRKLGKFPMSTVIRIQPSSRQSDNAEKVLRATAGDGEGGTREALSTSQRLVTIPMFRAKGLVVKRAGGESVTPYYFSLEDLKDDWNKLLASPSAAKLPANPKVEVVDFTEVMCLSQGISTASVQTSNPGKATKQLELKSAPSASAAEGPAAKASTSPSGATTTGTAAAKPSKKKVDFKQLAKVAANPGIVPPRREIDMIRRYYRNEAGIKNEFQKSYILGLT